MALGEYGNRKSNGSSLPARLDIYPKYEEAHKVEEIAAEELTEKQFLHDYWHTNKPLLIKGAINHWPAVKNWRSQAYLKDSIADHPVVARSTSPIDMPLSKEMKMLEQSKNIDTTFHSLLEQLFSDDTLPIWLAAQPFSMNEKAHPKSQWALEVNKLAQQDILGFPFLQKEKPARGYPAYRLLMYKKSFTDWHAHQVDSHFMCQVVGDKEVLLLPPNIGYEALQPIRENYDHTFLANFDNYPLYKNTTPYFAHVEEGDALHIPVYWPHVVCPTSSKMGVTIPFAFANPLHISGNMDYILAQKFLSNLPPRGKMLGHVAKLSSMLNWKYKPYVA